MERVTLIAYMKGCCSTCMEASEPTDKATVSGLASKEVIILK